MHLPIYERYDVWARWNFEAIQLFITANREKKENLN